MIQKGGVSAGGLATYYIYKLLREKTKKFRKKIEDNIRDYKKTLKTYECDTEDYIRLESKIQALEYVLDDFDCIIGGGDVSIQ